MTKRKPSGTGMQPIRRRGLNNAAQSIDEAKEIRDKAIKFRERLVVRRREMKATAADMFADGKVKRVIHLMNETIDGYAERGDVA